MLIKKGKTNWPYISIVFISSALAGGFVLFCENVWLPEELAKLQPILVQKTAAKKIPEPILLPNEIDENFLNQVNECFIPTAAVYGYELRITSAFRSLTEQDQIFDQGRTEDGHIVSWAESGKSIHNYGYAVDVVDRWHGYYINWERIAKIGNFCGLTQVDDAHFEYRDGLTTDQFAAGLRPSESLTLPCQIMNERIKVDQPLTLEDLQSCGAPDFWNLEDSF